MLVLGLVILVAAQAPATTVDNPLAPAFAGQLECTRPDDQKKTCRSIASYKLINGLKYANTTRIAISPAGPVIFENTSTVEVKGRSFCGTIKPEDITNGTLQVGGRTLSSDEAAPILGRIVAAMTPIMNKEICATYAPSSTGLVEKATIDGVDRPDADKPVKWITPSDGYQVAP